MNTSTKLTLFLDWIHACLKARQLYQGRMVFQLGQAEWFDLAIFSD